MPIPEPPTPRDETGSLPSGNEHAAPAGRAGVSRAELAERGRAARRQTGRPASPALQAAQALPCRATCSMAF